MGCNRHALRGTNRMNQWNLGLIWRDRLAALKGSFLGGRMGTKISAAHWLEYGNGKKRRQYIERDHDGKNGEPAARGLMQSRCKRAAEDGTYTLRHVQKTVIRDGMPL